MLRDTLETLTSPNGVDGYAVQFAVSRLDEGECKRMRLLCEYIGEVLKVPSPFVELCTAKNMSPPMYE